MKDKQQTSGPTGPRRSRIPRTVLDLARSASGEEERQAGAASVEGGLSGIGSFLSWLGGVAGQLEDLAEKGKDGVYEKQGEFTAQGGKARGVYGVSVKMGLGGAPSFQRFGNIQPTEKGPEVSDVREPLADVFDEVSEVVVVAELPGASEEEISIAVEDKLLKIEAKGEIHYAKEIELPAKVQAAPAKKVYRNGLLEIRLTKAAD